MQYRNAWELKINNANKYYEEWENRFQCKALEEYYEGFHYGTTTDNAGLIYKPYTLNVIYAAIKSKLATILFQNPEYIVKPRAGRMDFNQEFAVKSATLKMDMLNTIVSNPNLDVPDIIKMAALDGFFRFSVAEIGYSASWENPNKQHLEMKSHESADINTDKDTVVEDNDVPVNEQIYFKWIPAKTFRVSTSDGYRLKNCSWTGYYEFIYRDVLEKTKGIKMPKDFNSNTYSTEYIVSGTQSEELSASDISSLRSGEVLKVWRIWDNVSRKKLMILDSTYDTIFTDKFERIPFATNRFDLRLKGWYPIPPVWQWINPQNEINESREQGRRYRRRSTRKFQAVKGKVESSELEKFTNEIDGEVIIVKAENAISPIQNPDINMSMQDGLIQAKDDFDIVAGIPTSRGRASDRQTATAVNKLAQEEEIRQTVEQLDFNKFMLTLGRECILQAAERLSEGIWIKVTVDPGDTMEEMQSMGPIYQYVTSNQIDDGYDFDIELNIINATPTQMAEEEQKFIKFITLVSQFPQIALSPKLIRETAYRVGYRNEAIIAEMQKMALATLAEKAGQDGTSMLQASQNQGNGKGLINQGQPNSLEQIRSQMASQIGGNS